MARSAFFAHLMSLDDIILKAARRPIPICKSKHNSELNIEAVKALPNLRGEDWRGAPRRWAAYFQHSAVHR